MEIGDKLGIMINFINTMRSDKEDEFILVKPEWAGYMNFDVGSKKKKYQFIKGELAIPHNILKEEFKEKYEVIDKTRMFHYAYIPKKFINEKIIEEINSCEEDTKQFFINNPKVEEALDNLMEALAKVKYKAK